MSRQVDRSAITDEIKFPGKCQCKGEIHPYDWFKLRKLRSYTDDIAIQGAREENYGVVARVLMEVHVADWNLLDDDGEPLPITPYTLNNLSEADGVVIQKAINELGRQPKNQAALPND